MERDILRRAWVVAGMALAVLGAATGRGQDKDFSKGFQKFYQMGLPGVGKATYVQLNVFGPQSFERSYYLHEMKLSGNAWMLEENKTGVSRFVVEQCRVVDVYDQEALSKLRRNEAEAKEKAAKETPSKAGESASRAARRTVVMWGEEDGRLGGQWKKASAESDLDKMIAYVQKKVENPEKHDWVFNSGGYGTLFLSAIHFHEMGFTNKANRLVDLLFTHAGDRRKVLMQALNAVGDAQYEEAYDRLSANGEWASFAQALDGLLAKFATGWDKGPAVQRLAEKVKARAGQAQPPALQGESLTNEDQALALDLANAPDYHAGMFFQSGGLWVLSGGRAQGFAMGGGDHVIDRIQQRGMKSIPLLLALLKDDYLTRIDMQKLTGMSYSFNSSSDEAMSEEQITRLYNSLRRPASRGDVAAQLLTQVLPRPDNRRGGDDIQDRDALLDEGREWYQKNKDKKPVELARMYMQDGAENQKSGALQYLVRSGDESDGKAIEEYLLAPDRLMPNLSMIRQYVMAKGEKAKDFVDKYEAAVKRQQASGENAEMYKQEGVQKMLDQSLASLKEIVSARPAGELLDQLVKGEKTWQDIYGALSQKLSHQEPDQSLQQVLEAALKAQDPDVSRNLIYFAAQVPRLSAQAAYVDGMSFEEEAAEPAKPDIKAHAELWRKLLADTRTPAEAGMSGTLGDVAAWTIETLYDEQHGEAARRASASLGSSLLPVLRARAEDRLAGKPASEIAALPSEDKITPEMRKAVMGQVLGASAAELPALLAKLSAEERLALVLAGDEEGDKLSAKLTGVAHRIREVRGVGEGTNLVKECEPMKGTDLKRETVEKLHALCGRVAGEGRVLSCTVVRDPCLAGVVITLKAMAPGSKGFDEMMRYRSQYGADDNPCVVANLAAGMLHAGGVWNVGGQAKGKEKAKAEKPASAAGEDALLQDALNDLGEEQQDAAGAARKDFWAKTEQLCAGTNNVCRGAWIYLTGVPAPVKGEEKPK